MELVQQHCERSDGEMKVLSKMEAQEYLKQVSQWTLHQKSLEREIRFKNFNDSMVFLQKIAEIVKEEGHHPAGISIFYGRVRMSLSTNVLSGISLNDFILAAKIDRLL